MKRPAPTRLLRERFLADPATGPPVTSACRRTWACRATRTARSTNGRYHLMYLYNRTGSGFCWGHLSSGDLVHWRHHPDASGRATATKAVSAAGAFVDDDGTAYLSYWMLWGAKGIGLAKSTGPNFDTWIKLEANPIINSTEWGITEIKHADGRRSFYGSADPSNIWKKDGHYYLLTGNLLVLNKIGRAPGRRCRSKATGFTFHFRRPDIMEVSPCLLRTESGVDRSQRGQHVPQLPSAAVESRRRACKRQTSPAVHQSQQRLPVLCRGLPQRPILPGQPWPHDVGRIIPTSPRRPSWTAGTANHVGRGSRTTRRRKGKGLVGCLWPAPLALARRRRRPAPPAGEGVGNPPLPREVMERCRPGRWRLEVLPDTVGDACELSVRIEPDTAGRAGLKVRASKGARRKPSSITTRADASWSSTPLAAAGEGRKVIERRAVGLEARRAPEPAYLWTNPWWSFTNDRQAIGRRVYPTPPDSLSTTLFARGGTAGFKTIKAWEIMPSNPY